jgi:uncharacterized membrane protein YqjE
MNCNQCTRALLAHAQSGKHLGYSATQHLSRCKDCRAIKASLEAADDSELSVLPGFTDAFARQLKADLAPVKPLPPQSHLILYTAGAFVLLPAAVLAFIGIDGIIAMNWLQRIMIVGGLAAGEIALSDILVSLMVPGCEHRLNPLVLAGVVLVAFPALVLLLFESTGRAPLEATGCLVLALIVGAMSALWLFSMAARGAVLAWVQAGALIGILAGLSAVSVLEFHCAILDEWHRLFGHAVSLFILALAGLVTGWRLERKF